jgi:hypothetical protein
MKWGYRRFADEHRWGTERYRWDAACASILSMVLLGAGMVLLQAVEHD